MLLFRSTAKARVGAATEGRSNSKERSNCNINSERSNSKEWATPLLLACSASTFTAQSKKPADVSPFFSRANPHKICPSAKKSHVVTFCPKNGGPDVDFWALCAILGLPAVEVRRHPSLTSPGEQQSNQANILQIALRDFWLYKMGGHK